ncbi:MAG TPA: hypothetical protein VGQ32_10790, partial [Thermoanaerobaculia bacterium]|nr:hypothetical protein [Thermoanaerobaculia bacterium]
TRAVEPFAAAFLAIGLGTAWLAYAARPWVGLRWPAAIAADLLVLWAALRLAPSGPPQPGAEPSFSFFLLLAFALPFLYLGTFAVSTLVRRQAVTLFDAVQSIAALTVGFGGAALVVRYVEDAQPTLGASALLIAAGCYGVAFVFVERRQGHGRNFLFYATLALLLTAWGSVLVGSVVFRGYLWCALALVSAALASRYARATLAIHSAVYAAGAVWQSGLAAAALDALTGSAKVEWAPFSVAAACAIATAALAYVLLVRQWGASGVVESRAPRTILALLFAFGAGGLAVAAFHDFPAGRDPGIVAALRTSVLAAAALLLAGAGRRFTLPELSWLAYAVLILGGIKLLLEDLPSGRPATLFLAFAVYGAALVLAPRLLRRSPPAAGA